jgi:NAD(P)-dependent dehydrogenase (short-subunit alcohol dehydrogenase family)
MHLASSPAPVVLITGATSGIGAAAARRLFAAGFTLSITGRRVERLQTLATELDPSGWRVMALAGDVTSPADRKRWVERTLGSFGRIDALVNNAGYGVRGAVEDVPMDDIRRNFETNVFAVLELTRLCLPHLREARRGSADVAGLPFSGRIVNISSVAGRIARPLSGSYDATKHALEAFTDSLRMELRAEGLPVVSIQPGFIDTEFSATARDVSKETIQSMESGRYAALWAAVQAGERRLRGFAGRPEDVARVIERALTVPRPPPRYLVPFHAKLFVALKRLLPERLFMLGMPGARSGR